MPRRHGVEAREITRVLPARRVQPGSIMTKDPRYALLAEDDAALRRFLKLHLATWGLTVIEAHDRAHLADVMDIMKKDAGAGIDVIVSELQMLGMGAGEIRARLRTWPGTTPMIVLAGTSDRELAGVASDAGAKVFGKPFDIDDLGDAIVHAVSP